MFLISLAIKALLTLNYEKLLKLRITYVKHEIIDTQEMHQLNATASDDKELRGRLLYMSIVPIVKKS